MVVDRVPRGGDVGLSDDEGAVVGVEEAGDAAEHGITHRLGHALVAHDDREERPSAQPARRHDGELGASPRRNVAGAECRPRPRAR